jgi:hypothetical protein
MEVKTRGFEEDSRACPSSTSTLSIALIRNRVLIETDECISKRIVLRIKLATNHCLQEDANRPERLPDDKSFPNTSDGCT